jgi:uncharacterized protein YycO
MDAPKPVKGGRAEQHGYQEVREEMRTGDLLCFRGKDLDSRIISALTRSEYSHVGLVFLYEGRVYCLEAVGAGVRLVLMSRRSRLYNGGIDYFRLRDVTEEQRRGAVSFVFQRLGEPYNYPGILRFLWFLLSGDKERARRRNGWFCSEIVAEAYRLQKAPLVQRQAARYVSPADLARSERVERAFEITRD